MAVPVELERLQAPDRDACMMPQPLGEGLFKVDATWGHVQPMTIAPGVVTVGELEVIEHLQSGGAVIDTRKPEYYREATIPGARLISHEDILENISELDRDAQTVFFCNGPPCAATPDAIKSLLDAGFPAEAILYYRGGMHDWMTLGYPTVSGS